MKLTFSQVAKMFKKLDGEHTAIIEKEKKSRTFNAALGEDVESVRPAYQYNEIQLQLEELEKKMRKLKHAMNVFNITHTVPGYDMTIDEMLVYIPQLTARKQKLFDMKGRLPKERVEADMYRGMYRGSSMIDYRYINYDLDTVTAAFDSVSDELSRAQLALDTINNSVTMDIDL